MSRTYHINVQITNNQKPRKDIKESVNFATTNLKDYVGVLRNTQKAVNAVLTEAVDEERTNEIITVDDEVEVGDDDDSDDDEKPNTTAKRKLPSSKVNKKMKL